MLKDKVLIIELLSPNWSSSSSITSCEISSLNHEIRNDSMELWSLESKLLSVIYFISLTKSNKVLNSLWDLISEHIDNNITSISAINIYWEGDSMSWFNLNNKTSTSSSPHLITNNKVTMTNIFLYMSYLKYYQICIKSR